MAAKFIKQIFLLLASSYFIAFVIVSHVALFKCATDDYPRYSCPLMKPQIKSLYEHMFAGVLVDPIMQYLETFDTTVINILIFSGYLAFMAEIISIGYALIVLPCATFESICTKAVKVIVVIAIAITIIRIVHDPKIWHERVANSKIPDYFAHLYSRIIQIFRHAGYVAN